MKTMRSLASEIAKREGKKSEARVGDIREILGILSDIVYETNFDTMLIILDNGVRRSKRRRIPNKA